MTLLLDLTEEIPQLHYLSMYLGHRETREDTLHGSLAEVVAKIPSLVQQEQNHGQVGPEALVQSLCGVRCLARADPTHCSDHIQILQYGLVVGEVSVRLKSHLSRHRRRQRGWNKGCSPSYFLSLCLLNRFTL